jgi:hypothetical protein
MYENSSSSIQTLTVAIGVAPIQPLMRVAEYTASRELHSSLKIYFMQLYFTPF